MTSRDKSPPNHYPTADRPPGPQLTWFGPIGPEVPYPWDNANSLFGCFPWVWARRGSPESEVPRKFTGRPVQGTGLRDEIGDRPMGYLMNTNPRSPHRIAPFGGINVASGDARLPAVPDSKNRLHHLARVFCAGTLETGRCLADDQRQLRCSSKMPNTPTSVFLTVPCSIAVGPSHRPSKTSASRLVSQLSAMILSRFKAQRRPS